jgi:hypothetical protein
MSDDEIKGLLGLSEKATAGPWVRNPRNVGNREVDCEIVGNVQNGYNTPVCRMYVGMVTYEADKEFVAASRQALPALAKEVLESRKLIERMKTLDKNGYEIACDSMRHEQERDEAQKEVLALRDARAERDSLLATLEFLCRNGYPHHPDEMEWRTNGEAINKAMVGKSELLEERRDAALEEAAKECERCLEKHAPADREMVAMALCAESIRALKGKVAK